MLSGLNLSGEMLFVLGLTVFTLVMFTLEWVRADVVALLVLVALGITGIVPTDQLFDGFAGNAVLAIMATMILGAGLDRTGVLNSAASYMLRISDGDERRLLLVLCAITGAISAVMQNPAVTALFLPVVARISSRTGLPLSRLLLPMACCIILGGTMTMVGNSPQILLNDLVLSVNRNLPSGADTIEPFAMFSVTPIGLALLLSGLAYFHWFWPKLMPTREDERQVVTPGATASYFESTYGIEGEVIELMVPAESALIGLSIAEVEAQPGTPLILAIKIGEEARLAPPADQMLWANTILGALGPRERIHEWAQQQGLRVLPKARNFGAMFNPTRAGIAEAVIPPSSRFIGQKVGELRLRKRFGISVLAVNRGDRIWREELRGRGLRQGDTLVFHGAWRDLAHAAEDHDFVVVTDYPKDEERPHRLNHAIVFFALSLVLALLSDLPLPVALLTGAVGMLLTGVLNMDEAYRAINWKTILIMASLIPLGWAMDSTGAAAWIAQEILIVLGDVPVWALQLALMILTSLFAQVMSQVGATVVMVPMAINIALAANANPMPFALLVTLSASNNFTSTANPVISLVASPASYRHQDLMRAGLPLGAIFVVVALVMVNLVY
ncbi:MAG: SLC13 family permease [Xanthomonadales bacterium]|nr:SLC13 family permease [Xanthomonadales bacterium]